ncbi:TonB-dependent receptor [Anaeromyxobacter dehalogenans 2CP-1]|uniref:TonB-dependent receptor n=1 Tax=Anaeromyxobacter dehalogenans (strain ATCC BAA-258 / DSM 21875 / 2CP-1) TaxID=455488 RepID=B8JH54_ANAD2|nr:TonB-dependent receptor [Anaeromyxobacter dehalogenans]ACL64756.1 TonB-dependent receptor [Anaeromyxobacter dehalogenans 2CP-1]
MLYAGARRFDPDRARFGPERATEALAARQRVPSSDLGGSLVWSAPARGALRLTAGGDLRRVAGAARETLFPATAAPDAAVAREADGSQLLGGVFAEGGAAVAPGLELSAALRVDLWRNGEATGLRRAAGGGEDRTRYAPRSDAQVSPRVALRWRPGQGPLALRASAYRAFRAPTLNELYRTFQVGTIVTAPDPSLRAETLLGAEAGPELAVRGGALRLRVTGFWSVLRDPITVVTLDAPLPDGATRRRANLGAARIRGLEAAAAWAPLPWLEARAAWTFVDARVASAPGHPELSGRALPQDPRHRAAVSLAAWRAGLGRLGAELRAVSRQYEDDRNALPMGGYVLLDLAASVPLRGGLEAFAAAENVLDRRYLVGRAGVDTIGAPRMVRAGLRVRMGGE